MTDSYKIIISISHHRISFEYYLEGGDDMLTPMPSGNWPAPLAFYCSPTGIIIGEEAARAAQSGTANAFINYFDLLPRTDIFYEIGGERKPIGKMLLDASETIFREFYSSVLLNRSGNLNDNRLNMPLTIVCEADIKVNERVYIRNTFKDSGYDKVYVTNYDKYIDRYVKETLSHEYDCAKVLVAWVEGRDLCLTLFDASGQQAPVSEIFPELGVDPRLNFVTSIIWDSVSGENPWLDYETEIAAIQKAAIEFLNSSQYLVNDAIIMSDGRNYRYSLLRSNIDFIQSEESLALRRGVDNFLQKTGTSKSTTLLLLRGAAAGNDYFESNLRNGFFGVVRSDKDLRNRTMKLIVNDSNNRDESSNHINSPFVTSVPPKSPPAFPAYTSSVTESNTVVLPTARDERAFKELKSSVRTHIANLRNDAALAEIQAFLSQMHSRHIHAFDEGVEELKATVPENIPQPKTAHQEKAPDSQVSSTASPKDKRSFTMAKHEAKAALANGDQKKASEIMTNFRSSMHSKNISEFDEEIDSLLNEYSQSIPTQGRRNTSSAQSSRKPEKKKSAVDPSPRDIQQWRLTKRVVDSRLNRKDKAGALKELKEFADTMYAKGVHSFDDEIKEIKKKITS